MGKTFKDRPRERSERRLVEKEDRRKEKGGHKNLLRSAMEEIKENLDADSRES